MNSKRILIFLLFSLVFFFGWSSCNHLGNNSIEKAVVDQADSCLLNPKHTYQVFVPAFDKKCSTLPLMIAIDPHGAGKFAVTRFEEAAQKYPAIVVASNLIKNNYTGYIQSLEELISDVKNKYPVGNRIFIGGFSGGARMAIDYALNHRVDGVIACGALAPPEQIKALKCPLMAIIGIDDFNFIEAAQFVLYPESAPQNLLIELSNDTHEWPRKKLLSNALGYIQLSVAETNSCLQTKSLEKYFVEDQKSRIDSLIHSKETIKAILIARNMSNSETFEKSCSFRTVYKELLQGIEFKNQQEELIKSIRFELKVRDTYLNAMLQKDSLWWRKEINTLNINIMSEKNINSQMTFSRIKGFLGIVCYSLSNRYATAKDTVKLEQILSVYRMVEPENSDMLNFSRVLKEIRENDLKQK